MAARDTPSAGGKPDKLWRDALMIAAKRTEAETMALLADKSAPMLARAAARCMLLGASDKPDVSALKELGDRLDGKPKQQTELTGGEDENGNAIPLGLAVGFVGSKPNTAS